MHKAVRQLTYALVAIGILANVYFMLTNGEPDKLWWWTGELVFFVWTAIPFVGIATATKCLSKGLTSAFILFITSIIITFGGVYALVETFIVHLDPQSGIIFIFLPFYQLVHVAVGVGLALLTKKLL